MVSYLSAGEKDCGEKQKDDGNTSKDIAEKFVFAVVHLCGRTKTTK
jgi:hypothetical protein